MTYRTDGAALGCVVLTLTLDAVVVTEEDDSDDYQQIRTS
jgi:hypothetical protein